MTVKSKSNRERARVCDYCGAEWVSEISECEGYVNIFNRRCYAPPKKEMIVLSIPGGESRRFFNFCSLVCLVGFLKVKYGVVGHGSGRG